MDYRVPDGFARGDVDAGGIRLNYWRRGHGQPLLVLHGVTDWGLDWARFARRVEDRIDGILLDQRGHGYSDKPASGYAYADFARDARYVIERLGLKRPAVLGHSMGGGVALALAAEYPDAIDRLLLVDPAIRLELPGQDDQTGRIRPPAEQRRASLKARQALGRQALFEELRSSRPTFDDEDIANTVESTLLVSPFVHGDQRWFDPAAQEAQLRRLACPTLVVRGEPARGAIISDAAAARIRELVPHDLARVTTIAGTGHLPQREAFELFVAVVLPFLAGERAPQAEGGTPACFAHLLPQAQPVD
ncbi:MAG: alpha/beta hydrolase [Chloroflexi bacterium]|nr:alpha/beta hydrolase [Chloroflexota bacterium]